MRVCVGVVAAAWAACLSTAALARSEASVFVPAIDYPAGLTPDGNEHEVVAEIDIGPQGDVSRCEIRRSSKIAPLDAATCRLLGERGMFAFDFRGRSRRIKLQWAAEPSEWDRNEPGTPLLIFTPELVTDFDYPRAASRRNEQVVVTYEVDVSEEGRPLACRVIESSKSTALDRRTCEAMMRRAAFIPASDGAGGRRRGVYSGRMMWVM